MKDEEISQNITKIRRSWDRDKNWYKYLANILSLYFWFSVTVSVYGTWYLHSVDFLTPKFGGLVVSLTYVTVQTILIVGQV